MDWANLGWPCLLVPTFTNRRFKEGLRMPYSILFCSLKRPITYVMCVCLGFEIFWRQGVPFTVVTSHFAWSQDRQN